MQYQSVVDRVKELIRPLLEQKGVELVELTYRQEGRRMILRFLVDKEQGITLEECTALNEDISMVLDRDDTIATSYILEVSSPGLDRPLVTKRDFERVMGKKMEVFLKNHLHHKLSYTGKLKGVKEDAIVLERENAELVEVPLNIINKGRLKIDFGRRQR